MEISISRFSLAILALTLVGGSLVRADDHDDEASRLEVKHIGPSGNVSVETGLTPRPAMKLVPFAEDEEEAAATTVTMPVEPPRSAAKSAAPRPAANRFAEAKPAEPKPVKLPPKKSTFQPKFKAPAVRQVQHVEPSEKGVAVEHSTDDETRGPEFGAPISDRAKLRSPATTVDSPGRLAIEEAFAKSKAAATEDDYTQIIELCRRARQEGLKKNFQDYACHLMGWAYNRRGEMRARTDRDKEALADFELAVELNGSSWRAVHNRAVSYAAHGRIKEALTDFNRAIKLNGKYPNAHFNRAEMFCQEGDFAAAIRDYTTALKLGGPDPAILNSRGHAFYRLQQFGEALGDYGEALRIDPHNVAALINRGDAYCDVGQYADAAQDYRGAVQADPKLGRAYQSAAWLMATCPDEHYRNEKLAIEAAGKAIALDGENYRNLETLAAAEANAGAFDDAKQTQEKAIAMAPRQAVVAAEKRMALYQRELAFREQAHEATAAAQDEPVVEEPPVRRASASLSEYPPQRTTQRPRKSPKPPMRGPGRY